MSESKARVVGLVIYAISLSLIQYCIVSSGFTPNEKAIWLFNGFAGLLFGSRLLNPYFTPPADAATNSFFAAASFIAGATSVAAGLDAKILTGAAILCGIVCLASLCVLLVRAPKGTEERIFVRSLDRAVCAVGNPSFIFTFVIVACVWLFHRAEVSEVFAILAIWSAIAFIKPVEALLAFINWIKEQISFSKKSEAIGTIAAYQSPGIVLIRQFTDTEISRGTALLIVEERGAHLLGVALNYVGRDEGTLLRVLTTKFPENLKGSLSIPKVAGGLATSIPLSAADKESASVFQWIDRLCGVVDSDTSLDHLNIEVTDESEMSQGRLVAVRVGDKAQVLYQVIDGLTREDVVQQKNKYGYARAKARKIGVWDNDNSTFKNVKWLPKINAPTFVVSAEAGEVSEKCVGRFPNTNYGVGIDISLAVTHNTAILGILGIGKSYLAIELVERMIAQGIKVLCLDLTNQYADRLQEFLDPQHEAAALAELVAAGGARSRSSGQRNGRYTPSVRAGCTPSAHRVSRSEYRKISEDL
jgi:hypothetical protein